MNIKIIKEAYRKMVSESPEYDKDLTRSQYGPHSFIQTTFNINKNHPNATHLGGNHFHLDNGDNEHHFYHKNDKEDIDVLSTVSDGIHTHFWKAEDVSSDKVKQNFQNALQTLGEITSDITHSNGSRKFWFNIHKNFPEHRVSMLHRNTETNLDTHEDMVKNEKKIWDTKNSHEVRLKIYAK